jgi:3'(2'), 5'-bisphosphate nucleotidase
VSDTERFPKCYILGIASANIDPTWLVEKSSDHELKDRLPESLLNANLNEFTVWVDPLDATKEYSEGFLDHVTVLIGIALGKTAVAGVIHQPFYG